MDLTNFDISLKFVYACIYFLAIDKQNKCVFYTVRPIKNVNRYRLLYFKIKLSQCIPKYFEKYRMYNVKTNN